MNFITHCDIVIYDKKYMFGFRPLFLAQSSKNPWDFPSDEKIKVSFLMLMRRLLDSTQGPRVGAGCQGNPPSN